MRYPWIVLGWCVLVLYTAPMEASDGYRPLFDGKTLAGWKSLPGGTWEVRDGVIVGTQDEAEKRHGILWSDDQYGDFAIRFKYKSLVGNSGLYFRAQPADHAVAVRGFQAEIDADGNDVGGLYETLGRAWVVRPKPNETRELYKLKDWNEMSVIAVGGDVIVTLNGVQTAAVKGDPGERRGHFGLQLHGGQKMHVLFKDLEIRDLTGTAQSVLVDRIHDKARPLPPVVQPRSLDSLQASRLPPHSATVLFDGANLDHWEGGPWRIVDGTLETGTGDLTTKLGFGDCRLHVEWRVVDREKHGNSGIYLMNLYEVQIFNSYHNSAPIYADGQAAAIYGQYPPLVNACREPGQWEVFDITFRRPHFDEAGRLMRAAKISLLHNGVVAQDGVTLTGPTMHKDRPLYERHADNLPIRLQYHGDTLQFRNIWIERQ